MAKFPALEPYERSWSLASYPITVVSDAVRFKHGNIPANQRMTLQYMQLTAAQAKLIRDHYRGQQGGLAGFALSAEAMAGITSTTTLQPYSLLWRYESPPSETHRKGGFVDVTVELQSVSGAASLSGLFVSTFSGTKVNAFLSDAVLYASVSTTETWQTHYTGNSYASPYAQVAAGYPYYLQPHQSTGSYTEEFDTGAEIAAANVVATLTYSAPYGTPTVTPTISVKRLAGDPWTNYAGASAVYATAFRYVKVAYAFTSGLIKATAFTVKIYG